MFDLSQVETKYETFNKLTKKYLINCLVGSAHLTGDGTLTEYFDEIIEEAVERGQIAIIEYTDNKEKFLTITKSKQISTETEEKVKENLLKEPINLEFQLLDNANVIVDGKEVEKYVIFKFNKEGTTPLFGLEF